MRKDINLYSQSPIQHPLCFGKPPAKLVDLIIHLNLCKEERDLHLCADAEVLAYLRFGQLFSTQESFRYYFSLGFLPEGWHLHSAGEHKWLYFPR